MLSDANYKMKISDSAIDFSLKATNGKTYALNDFKKPILVLFFTCNHCPYAQAYNDRVNKLAEEFGEHADFIGINSNDAEKYHDDSYEEMKKHAPNFKYVYLHDESQETAKAYGGECTPHFFVFDKERKLQYQGRLDDNWRDESQVTKQELKEAIQALINGEPVPVQVTNAIGCSIKWK